MISLFIQEYYREILAFADEQGGRLPNKVIMFLDEIRTIPKIQSAEMMFSASRSRGVSIVAIIQSLAQLEKNYGKEGAAIITDNCQDTLFGGFAPNSETAKIMSENLGYKTVLSGSVSKGKNDPSQSLQMIQRNLLTTDELKALPKGTFVLMKTGTHPILTKLKLFSKWGIQLNKVYKNDERSLRTVEYANVMQLEDIIRRTYGKPSSMDEANIEKIKEKIMKGSVKVG